MKVFNSKVITKEFRETSTNDEIILAELLLLNPVFLKKIDGIRKRNKIIPRFNITEGKAYFGAWKRIHSASKRLCKEFGLTDWTMVIYDFIYSGRIRKPRYENYDLAMMRPSSEPLSVDSIPPPASNKFIKIFGFVLTIKRRVTKQELHDLIDKNWESIERTMLENTKEEFKTKMRNLDFYKEILDLKDNKHKSFEEIANILSDKYLNPENPEFTDKINADSVKTAYHRIKNYVASLSNR